jgi:hypothetical protein
MSLINKLNTILDIKESIKTSINNKGGNVGNNFSEYAIAIDNLSVGDGGSGNIEKVDVGKYGLKFNNPSITEIPTFFDFTNATDYSNMFRNCYSLQNFDLNRIQWEKVTNINYMFTDCGINANLPQTLTLPNVWDEVEFPFNAQQLTLPQELIITNASINNLIQNQTFSNLTVRTETTLKGGKYHSSTGDTLTVVATNASDMDMAFNQMELNELNVHINNQTGIWRMIDGGNIEKIHITLDNQTNNEMYWKDASDAITCNGMKYITLDGDFTYWKNNIFGNGLGNNLVKLSGLRNFSSNLNLTGDYMDTLDGDFIELFNNLGPSTENNWVQFSANVFENLYDEEVAILTNKGYIVQMVE